MLNVVACFAGHVALTRTGGASKVTTTRGPKRPRLYMYIRGILKNIKVKPVVIGGIEDHVRIYCDLPSTLTIAQLVATAKSNSTTFAKEELRSPFAWQEGYAAFTT